MGGARILWDQRPKPRPRLKRPRNPIIIAVACLFLGATGGIVVWNGVGSSENLEFSRSNSILENPYDYTQSELQSALGRSMLQAKRIILNHQNVTNLPGSKFAETRENASVQLQNLHRHSAPR